jgi:hypothetical protein
VPQHMRANFDPELCSAKPALPSLRSPAHSAAHHAPTQTQTQTSHSRADACACPKLPTGQRMGAGVPLSMRRTCRVAAVKSICSQGRSQTSAARSPCRKARRVMSVSRWPCRLMLTASISRSTSSAVACSHVRSLAFGRRAVRFTVAGATRAKDEFAITFRSVRSETVQCSVIL